MLHLALMQKRHYEAIADILKEAKHTMGDCHKEDYTVSHNAVVHLFAKRLEEMNENFNADIFFKHIRGDE